MLGHLGSLIPGQRPSQLFGQGSDRARNRFAHCLSSMDQVADGAELVEFEGAGA
jgi:hypothetical protein